MKNRYFVSGNLTVIEIKNRNRPEKTFYTIIDTHNLQKVLNNCLLISVAIDSHTNYAIATTKDKKPKGLHRILLNTPKGLVVDHRNHNGLDNRESNIWNCTHQDNSLNRREWGVQNPEYISPKERHEIWTQLLEDKEENQKEKEIEDYPIVLTADHIQEILGIGRRSAYELMDEKGFPLVRIGKKFKRVNRDDFFDWLNSQSQSNIS